MECDETRCRDRGAPAFRAGSASSQQFSSRSAFLCFQWFGPLTIVHSNLNANDICTVGAPSLFSSLGGKSKSTAESSTCIVSRRSAAWWRACLDRRSACLVSRRINRLGHFTVAGQGWTTGHPKRSPVANKHASSTSCNHSNRRANSNMAGTPDDQCQQRFRLGPARGRVGSALATTIVTVRYVEISSSDFKMRRKKDSFQ